MAATPLLGGDVTSIRVRLSPDSFFKTTLRYRVKDENGNYQWTDFPVGAQVEVRFPKTAGGPDFAFPADSIVGQYAKFLIDGDDVNSVIADGNGKGQIWFDDTTGFELVASGPTVIED